MSLALRALVATAVLAAAQPGLASDVRWLTQTQPQNAQYPTESAAIDGFPSHFCRRYCCTRRRSVSDRRFVKITASHRLSPPRRTPTGT